MRTWGPRVMLAAGVVLAAWGFVNALNRHTQTAYSAAYSFSRADWALIAAGAAIGVVALAWNAWEWYRDRALRV